MQKKIKDGGKATAARASELARALDALPIALYTTDSAGRLTYFNGAAIEMFGRVPRLGVDRWCVSWRLYHPDGTPMAHDECPMAVALRESRPVRGKLAIAERPDGTRFTFMPYPAPLLDEQGGLLGAVNALVDVTEQQTTRQALEASERRYRDLVGLLPVGLYRCEAPSGAITFFNEKAAELWGRSPRLGDTDERFCGSWRLWLPDGRPLPHDQTPMARALQSGESFRNQEVVIERQDGSRIAVIVNIDPIRGAGGEVVGAINVFHDVTLVRQAETGLARLAAIVDSSDDAIVSKTLDGVITSWNRGAEKIFGYTAAEAVGRSIMMIIPAERRAEEDDVLARIRRGDKVDHFETERRRKDGSRIDISLTVSPLRDSTGRIIGASKIARDITERVRTQAALREADRRKDEFLATLAHELRNPLAPMSHGLEILRMCRDDERVIGQTLDVMQRQLGQLVRLIDDLLDVNRISNGKIVLQRERITLRQALDRALEMVEPHARARRQEVVLTVPGERILLDADLVRLAQLFSNLLNNAVKFSPAGGAIRIVAARDGADVVVSVEDEGIGIPPDMLGEIFEPFRQIHRPAEEPNAGLGIGLMLVKRLAELHGGSVQAYSEGPNRGSRFSVRLPTWAGAERPAAGTAAAAPGQGSRRVLLVDDNRDAAESLGQLLQLLGHRVHLAHDGPSAVADAARLHPEVVLLDIGLPGANGYQACRAIRQNGNGGAPPVMVALTGWGQENDRERAFEAGFDHHLVKPVDIEVLSAILARGQTAAPPAGEGSGAAGEAG